MSGCSLSPYRPTSGHEGSPNEGVTSPLGLLKLTALLERSSGRAEVQIGLIDGPVAINHPDLASAQIREISGSRGSMCTQASSTACVHGTFVAGILCAERSSVAPAICPDCTLLVRPLFTETNSGGEEIPSATPQGLAAAIVDCIEAGARLINLSLALAQPSTKVECELEEILSHAMERGVIVVAAAGNQGTLGSTAITRHPWVIPVVACDLQGKPLRQSNLGSSIGRRGLSAPGENIISLDPDGHTLTLGGTSVSTPFVTGAIALLWSEFPSIAAAEMKLAVTQSSHTRRNSVVPPLLDAWAAYQVLRSSHSR